MKFDDSLSSREEGMLLQNEGWKAKKDCKNFVKVYHDQDTNIVAGYCQCKNTTILSPNNE